MAYEAIKRVLRLIDSDYLESLGYTKQQAEWMLRKAWKELDAEEV